MTKLLSEAFERASKLPAELQDALASDLIEIMEGDLRWEQLLADPRSEQLLGRLADEAVTADRAGKTTTLRGRRGVKDNG